MRNVHHSSWNRSAANPVALEDTVDRLVQWLKKSDLDFEAIAVSGVSGLVVGGALSYATGIPLVVVRKSGDKKHSDFSVESSLVGDFKYVILDDLISSGSTIKRIITKIERDLRFYDNSKDYRVPECVGIILYYATHHQQTYCKTFGRGQKSHERSYQVFSVVK